MQIFLDEIAAIRYTHRKKQKNVMRYSSAKNKLKTIRQDHLLCLWDSLSEEQKSALLDQIEKINVPLFKQQQALIGDFHADDRTILEPFYDYHFAGNTQDKEKGFELICKGKVGCLLIAGGMGTRLGCNGPKGVIPVTPITRKSLFQVFAEKTLAAGKQAQRQLPLAIMTSPQNDQETRDFFEGHHLFGLDTNQLHFFTQDTLPFLNEQKNLFLEKPALIANGPDGNGSSLAKFVESGIWGKWQKLGVEYVTYILVDNVLADPFDAELIGYHVRHQDDVTIKCVKKREPNEKVGVVVRCNGQVQVKEYNEMTYDESHATHSNGTLKHICANISQFCFRMSFIQETAKKPMPLHIAFKPAKMGAKDIQAWKFEKYVFDVLVNTQKVHALLYPREVCFSPLKNREGKDSLQTVQADLLTRDQLILQQLTHKAPPSHPFELSQDFHYPTPDIISKWKNHLTNHTTYIEP